MSTTRLFSPASLQTNTEVSLGSDQARYIGKVLRLKRGDFVTLFDGSGGEFISSIAVLNKSSVTIDVREYIDTSVESRLEIHLLQCVSRGERMEFVVQKSTELGVQRITPLLSEFSVVKLDNARAEKRQLHWSKIATSACEQCGRNKLPQIDTPTPLRNWFGNNLPAPVEAGSTASRYVLSPGASQSLSTLTDPGQQIMLLIGPEGGFSDAEVKQAAAAGFTALNFGPRVMRTETAAISAIAALQTLYGDLA